MNGFTKVGTILASTRFFRSYRAFSSLDGYVLKTVDQFCSLRRITLRIKLQLYLSSYPAFTFYPPICFRCVICLLTNLCVVTTKTARVISRMGKLSSSDHSKRVNYGIGAVFLLITAGLSFYELNEPSIWVDEAFTWLFPRLSWGKLFDVARIDGVNPPLYYVVVKWIVAFVEADETGLRALSTFANLAAQVGVLILGYRVGGRPGMVVSAWFWTFHPMALWYARDARPYALVTALAVFLVLVFIQRTERLRTSKWLLSSLLLMSLGILTHYFFFVLVAALTFYRLYQLRDRSDLFREWTILLFVALIPLLIWIGWYLQQAQPSLGIGWIQIPTLLDLPKTIWNMLSGYAGVVSPSSTLFGLVGLVLVALAFRQGDRDSLTVFASVFGVLIPLVAVWLVSQRRPVYVDRYFMVLLPFMVILLSKGASNAVEWFRNRITNFQRWSLQLPLLIILLLIGIWSAMGVHLEGKFEHEDWRGLVDYLQNNSSEGDKILLMEPEVELPMAFYGWSPADEGSQQDLLLCDGTCWWV